jgi:G3E family GTPase
LTPLLLVTGFLGAGKTSLIAALLRRRAARQASGRIGLLVNELGAVGIDGDLLADGITAQVELPGGCVCCALGDDLAQSILAMLDQQPDLDAIILETTGVAEPLPIAWALERAPLADRVRLASVITLVDAENFLASRALSASVDAQIAYADILIQTKGELVSAATSADVKAVAMGLAARALWYAVPTLDAAQILDDIVSDPPLLVSERAAHAPMQHCAPGCDHTEHGHDHGHGHASVHGITSVALALPMTTVDAEDLEDAITAIPDSAVRIKGITRVALPAGETWIAFHRVGPRYSWAPLSVVNGAATGKPVVPQPRIVVLGNAVSTAMVRTALRALYSELL